MCAVKTLVFNRVYVQRLTTIMCFLFSDMSHKFGHARTFRDPESSGVQEVRGRTNFPDLESSGAPKIRVPKRSRVETVLVLGDPSLPDGCMTTTNRTRPPATTTKIQNNRNTGENSRTYRLDRHVHICWSWGVILYQKLVLNSSPKTVYSKSSTARLSTQNQLCIVPSRCLLSSVNKEASAPMLVSRWGSAKTVTDKL